MDFSIWLGFGKTSGKPQAKPRAKPWAAFWAWVQANLKLGFRQTSWIWANLGLGFEQTSGKSWALVQAKVWGKFEDDI